jgi:hypothetical protein
MSHIAGSKLIAIVQVLNKQPKGIPLKFCPSTQDEFIAKYELLKAEMAENDV